ncbi:MAG: prolipoprotein diacylglyceryl transferase [Candidatus Hydrogenedentes bacterium]|nr:prolipoprotein diacylglyceryl transferase [Candidatus Hydrogenedentota bacterium]
MRPILFSIGKLFVGSYAAMMFLAVLVAIGATLVRARARAFDTSELAPALIVGLIGGWVVSRASLLIDPAARNAGWRVFSPLQGGGGSLTYFGIGAAVGVVAFLLVRRQPILVFADAFAPSILLAVGIAKIGCLLSGCCEGSVCTSAFGIAYPYGSIVHEKHFANGIIQVPSDLLRSEAETKSTEHTLGHIQALRYEAAFANQDENFRTRAITPELVDRAANFRSSPVWPVPIWTSLAAIVCGIAAEFVYRKRIRQGVTFAFALCAYGAIRLSLDWFLAERNYVVVGLSAAQWLGVIALIAGIAIYLIPRSVKLNPE